MSPSRVPVGQRQLPFPAALPTGTRCIPASQGQDAGGRGGTTGELALLAAPAPAPRPPAQVIGLDLSLRHAGIAYPDGSSLVVDGTKTRGAERWAAIFDAVARDLWPVKGGLDLAAIEGYAYAAAGRALFDLCELGGLVRWELHRRSIPWLVVPPTTLKKYATGKGQATKTEMVIAARERLGYDGADDNEADAMWLRAIGLDVLDEPPCRLPAVNRSVLKRLTWPEGAAPR